MLSNVLYSTISIFFERLITTMAHSLSRIEYFWISTFAPGSPNHNYSGNPSELEQQLLAQLIDIQTPDSIGLWPFAPGIWAIIIAIALSVCLYVFLHAQRKKNTYRRSALNKLEQLKHEYAKHRKNDDINARQHYIQAIITLLKQVMFTAYPLQRSHIAGLPSNDFILFLQHNSPKPKAFNSEQLHIPNDILYGMTQDSTFSPHMLARFATMWIKHHKTSYLLVSPHHTTHTHTTHTHTTHTHTTHTHTHTNTPNVSLTEETHVPS